MDPWLESAIIEGLIISIALNLWFVRSLPRLLRKVVGGVAAKYLGRPGSGGGRRKEGLWGFLESPIGERLVGGFFGGGAGGGSAQNPGGSVSQGPSRPSGRPPYIK